VPDEDEDDDEDEEEDEEDIVDDNFEDNDVDEEECGEEEDDHWDIAPFKATAGTSSKATAGTASKATAGTASKATAGTSTSKKPLQLPTTSKIFEALQTKTFDTMAANYVPMQGKQPDAHNESLRKLHSKGNKERLDEMQIQRFVDAKKKVDLLNSIRGPESEVKREILQRRIEFMTKDSPAFVTIHVADKIGPKLKEVFLIFI